MASDNLFAGSIPDIYARLLVPLIFESYAHDLAERLAGFEPQDVLEIAAGTGALTRAIATRLPLARIAATDLNLPMLDRASARQPPNDRIVWHQADALALPFQSASFDAAACQFGAMFFPDRIQAYREAWRVLKPGGHFLFSVWDRISENEFADAVAQALAERFPDDPPGFMAHVPHGYYDVDKIRGELTAAGFSEISICAVEKTSRPATPQDIATAFCQGTPVRNEIEARDATGLEGATRAVSAALSHRFGTDPVESRIKAYVIAAVR